MFFGEYTFSQYIPPCTTFMEDDREKEEVTGAHQDNSPSRSTIFLTIGSISIALVGALIWSGMRMQTSPETECSYRGGMWVSKSQDCLYEKGTGGAEQVGMTASTLALSVPESTEVLSFEKVVIGAPLAYTKQLIPVKGTKGKLSLNGALSRVYKYSEDIVMPFSISTETGGNFVYLAIFKKTPQGYFSTDTRFVGDRVAGESLVLVPSGDSQRQYVVRFSYRDRKKGESVTAIPTEPRVLTVTIVDHHITDSSVIGRDAPTQIASSTSATTPAI